MKLSEIKGDQALDVLADIIDPACEIISDKEIEEVYRSKKPKLLIVKLAIKNHKKAIITILALLNGEDPETFEPSLLTLPKMVLDLVNDPELDELFQSQGMTMLSESSFSATETTTEEEM